MIGFPWSFFGVARKYLEFIKRRLKVQEKNMSCEHALNYDQWKTFSEKHKQMGVGILPLLTKYITWKLLVISS